MEFHRDYAVKRLKDFNKNLNLEVLQVLKSILKAKEVLPQRKVHLSKEGCPRIHKRNAA
jgi:hypothetical protein